MKLTLKIKLLPTEEQAATLLETFREANVACNRISDVAWERKTFSQFKIHKLVYRDLKDSAPLSAQMIVRCISKVANAYKSGKKARRTFLPLGALTYDARILSYKKDSVSLWTVAGRQTVPFVCHRPDWLPSIKGEADLVTKKGTFFLLQTVEIPEEDVADVETFLGVDFGIKNLATDSTGETFSGETVEKVRQKRTAHKQRLQKKGTKNAKRRLKKISGREHRFKCNTNHVIAKTLVLKAKGTGQGIALEDLSGIRDRTTVRGGLRDQFGKWAFGQLRSFVEYKARLSGVPVLIVDPRNTSRCCSRCGHIDKKNRKSQSEFECVQCRFSCHADFNAAINIASRAAVNRPIAV